MPTAICDGISTHYEVVGSGPPLLMYAPGGFDATLDKWSILPSYARINVFAHLKQRYTCITFDRRECGESGGRIELFGWADFAQQGAALLDHLGIDRAHVAGGCMGVACALAFAAAHPQRTQSLTLIWPVGGAAYRISSHLRHARHLAFVQAEGLAGIVALARREGKHFGADPRGGPWATVLKNDPDFAVAFERQDADRYSALVQGIARTMYDRDTAPGAEPEQLMNLDVPALIIPGQDTAHATSGARYLAECLPRGEYWDVPAAEQLEANTVPRVLEFFSTLT